MKRLETTIKMPMYLANRLASYLDNLKADRLADQAGGLNRFTAEHQAVLAAVMQGIQGGPVEEPAGQAPAKAPKVKPRLAKPGPEAFKLGPPMTGAEGRENDRRMVADGFDPRLAGEDDVAGQAE